MSSLSILLLGLICISSLSGCVSLFYTCQQRENLKQECLQSKIFATDLTKQLHDQQIHLPDGRICPKDNI